MKAWSFIAVLHLSRLVHNVDASPFTSQLLYSANESGGVCAHSAALH